MAVRMPDNTIINFQDIPKYCPGDRFVPKLLVTNLPPCYGNSKKVPYGLLEAALRRHFEQFGPLISLVLKVGSANGPFAYVRYKYVKGTRSALLVSNRPVLFGVTANVAQVSDDVDEEDAVRNQAPYPRAAPPPQYPCPSPQAGYAYPGYESQFGPPAMDPYQMYQNIARQVFLRQDMTQLMRLLQTEQQQPPVQPAYYHYGNKQPTLQEVERSASPQQLSILDVPRDRGETSKHLSGYGATERSRRGSLGECSLPFSEEEHPLSGSAPLRCEGVKSAEQAISESCHSAISTDGLGGCSQDDRRLYGLEDEQSSDLQSESKHRSLAEYWEELANTSKKHISMHTSITEHVPFSSKFADTTSLSINPAEIELPGTPDVHTQDVSTAVAGNNELSKISHAAVTVAAPDPDEMVSDERPQINKVYTTEWNGENVYPETNSEATTGEVRCTNSSDKSSDAEDVPATPWVNTEYENGTFWTAEVDCAHDAEADRSSNDPVEDVEHGDVAEIPSAKVEPEVLYVDTGAQTSPMKDPVLPCRVQAANSPLPSLWQNQNTSVKELVNRIKVRSNDMMTRVRSRLSEYQSTNMDECGLRGLRTSTPLDASARDMKNTSLSVAASDVSHVASQTAAPAPPPTQQYPMYPPGMPYWGSYQPQPAFCPPMFPPHMCPYHSHYPPYPMPMYAPPMYLPMNYAQQSCYYMPAQFPASPQNNSNH